MKIHSLTFTVIALFLTQAPLFAQIALNGGEKLGGGGNSPLFQSFVNQDKSWYQDARQAYHGNDLVGGDGALSRLDWFLTYSLFQSENFAATNPGQPYTPDNDVLPYNNGLVLLEIICVDSEVWMTVEPALANLGATNISHGGQIINAWLPLANAGQASQLAGVEFIRPAYRETRAGLTVSQGDRAIRSDFARSRAPGVSGAGITIGTLSDSFAMAPDPTTTAPQDFENGDLPADVEVLSEFGQPASDEGRAMMQIIRDLAPGSAQKFFTAFNGQASFANGIRALDQAGCDIIVDDVFFFAEPFFQNGLIAQAVNEVTANGKAYFSAAGNSARQSYESEFRIAEGATGLSRGPLHDFDPGPETDAFLEFTIPVGTTLTFILQWDQPFFSVSGAPGCQSDLDIFLTGSGDAQLSVLTGLFSRNVGGDAVEIFTFTNDGSFDIDGDPGPDVRFNLAIEGLAGNAPGLMKILFLNRGPFSINEFDTQSGTLVGHANAETAIGVAAAPFFRTPVFNVDPPQLEDFSSPGGTPLLFADDGTRLPQALNTNQPRFTSADGANTTFFGQQVNDGDNFPNFFGTSAAAPHAAAVAALLLEKTGGPGTLTPSEIDAILRDTAIDMGTAGIDEESGAGLIDAQAAINFLITSGLATDVVMDISGQSWLNANVWDDDLAPSPEKDYFLAPVGDGDMLTTPAGEIFNSQSANFPGNSLTVPVGTTLRVLQGGERSASIRGGDGDLFLDGGEIFFIPPPANSRPFLRVNQLHVTGTETSTIKVAPNITRARFPTTLTGSGDLLITISAPEAINSTVVFAEVSDYTGTITVERGMTLDFNDSAFFPGGIELTGSAVLNVDRALTFEAGKLKDPVNGLVPPGIYSSNTLGENYRFGSGGTIIVSGVITVTTNADENDGTIDPTVGQGVSLREAITHPTNALNGNVINFAPGLNGQTIQLDADLGALRINQAITISANSLPSGIVIDGGSNGDLTANANETRCFHIDDGTTSQLSVTLTNLTIQKGVVVTVTDAGANILNRENLTLNQCRILDGRTAGFDSDGILRSQGSFGGGIFSRGGDLTLNQCLVSGNVTEGLFAIGGGIYARDGRITLEGCEISNNRARGSDGTRGGGINVREGVLQMSNSTISDNELSGALVSGGGIALTDGTPGQPSQVTRCTFIRNKAIDGEGGAITNPSGNLKIEHCTIVGNLSASKGAGISGGDFSSNTITTVTNSIVQNNNGPFDIAFLDDGTLGTISLEGNNLIGSVGPRIAEIAINPKPLRLAPLANYGGSTKTRPPLPGSPALDAAAGSASTTGQRGFGIVGLPDIGAVELQGDSITAEPILSFFFDTDKDGLNNGLEQALGSNPIVADFNNPNRLKISRSDNGELLLNFGYADPNIPLKLTRSTDLITFNVVIASSDDGLTANSENPLLEITDPNPPEDRAFYRLEANLPK